MVRAPFILPPSDLTTNSQTTNPAVSSAGVRILSAISALPWVSFKPVMVRQSDLCYLFGLTPLCRAT